MKLTTNLIGYIVATVLTFVLTSLYVSCDSPMLEEEITDSKRAVKKPNEIISLTQAVDMYTEYSRKRVPYIEEIEETDASGNPFKATRSLFFEYGQLNKYLEYVKQETSKRDIKVTGFRFYLAKYPENEYSNADARVKYPKRQTFFIAPTTTNTVDGEEFDSGFTLGQNGEILLLEKVLEGKSKSLGSNGRFNNLNEAGIANLFNWILQEEGPSLIANELNSSPPNGDQQ